MSLSKARYREEIKRVRQDILIAENVSRINSELNKLCWVFFHPYNLVGEVNYYEELIKKGNMADAESAIFHRFKDSFYDLRFTVILIEGFYKKRPFLRDFILQIEESILLGLQSDCSGAIGLIIPVIEGTLRNYLNAKELSNTKENISMSDLSAAFRHMADDYVKLQQDYLYAEYDYLKQTGDYFDTNQEKQILKLHRKYFEIWIDQLNDYLNNNLYLDTRKNVKVRDGFNRHILVHGFDNVNYSLKNFLRLLNCLNFLSWALGMINKECSVLGEVEDDVVKKKWDIYIRIMAASEPVIKLKADIFQRDFESVKSYIDRESIRYKWAFLTNQD